MGLVEIASRPRKPPPPNTLLGAHSRWDVIIGDRVHGEEFFQLVDHVT